MDAIIGVISGYGVAQVKHWVNSIRSTDFPGDIVLIDLTPDHFGFRPPDDDLETFCQSKRVILARSPLVTGRHICVERFKSINRFLNEIAPKKYEHVILTDVRDVVFQRSPTAFLEASDGEDFFFSSECLQYRNEPWGAQNMRESFGNMVAASMHNQEILNAGVIAGKSSRIADLCLAVYAMSMHANQRPPSGGGPDQSAFNIIVRTVLNPRDYRVFRTTEAWAAQVGTIADPHKMDHFSQFLLDKPFKIDKNTVRNEHGVSFVIVHQYDRNPEYLQLLGKRYE